MIFYVISAAVAALALVYLFLVFPRLSRRDAAAALSRDYAHRGLHENGIDENTLPAFEAACEAGYGIELDVQLASDGEVIVLHDYDTERICGEKYAVSDTDSRTLASLTTANGSHIPLFRDVLMTVGGRVPLLIELKGESFDTALCGAVHELLKGYGGEYCVESFNPMLLRAFKRSEPKTICGILSCDMREMKGMNAFLRFLLQNLLLNFLARPDFVAYKHGDRCFSASFCRFLGAKLFLWTPRGEKECSDAKEKADAIIFENEV